MYTTNDIHNNIGRGATVTEENSEGRVWLIIAKKEGTQFYRLQHIHTGVTRVVHADNLTNVY